jgi:hypothetical protein
MEWWQIIYGCSGVFIWHFGQFKHSLKLMQRQSSMKPRLCTQAEHNGGNIPAARPWGKGEAGRRAGCS